MTDMFLGLSGFLELLEGLFVASGRMQEMSDIALPVMCKATSELVDQFDNLLSVVLYVE